MRHSRISRSVVVVAAVMSLAAGGAPNETLGAAARTTPSTKPAGGRSPSTAPAPKGAASADLRPIRVAIFDVDVLKDVDVQGGAVTDQINTMLAALPKVTIVNRDQIENVAEEHKIALSGLVDTASAVKLGKLLSAQYIVAGRASKIAHTHYLVLKIVDVETTVQSTVAAKASVEDGFGAVIERAADPLRQRVRQLQAPLVRSQDRALAELRKLAAPLAGKIFLVEVAEKHLDRPLKDPAAQMAIAQRLCNLGMSVVVPKEPVAGWRSALLRTGKYGEQKVDYLLEGEGISAFAARIQGLVSCRARVELRLVPVPGRVIKTSDRGVAAGADLVEALAAKTALEDAGEQACDAIIRRLSAQGAR